MTKYDVLIMNLRQQRETGESYEAMARRFRPPITRAHIWKMINRDWEPEAGHLRAALGLPEFRPAPVCEKHGGIDCLKCGRKEGQPRQYQDLWAMPTAELRRRLEERETVEHE
jgi:hypothetical protein